MGGKRSGANAQYNPDSFKTFEDGACFSCGVRIARHVPKTENNRDPERPTEFGTCAVCAAADWPAIKSAKEATEAAAAKTRIIH